MNINTVAIKPEQIPEIIVRRHWLLIIPFCISMIVGGWAVYYMPRIYEARTVILIQPQKVPQDIVKSIVSTDSNARVTTLAQRITSRTNLEKIISEFNMFSGPEHAVLFMEDKITILRKKISVKMTRGGGRDLDSFEVAFRGTDPQEAMKVAGSLASYIIDENLKIRETLVLGTNTFLEDELSQMRNRLILQETILKEFREKYMGGLPEQLETNLAILANLNERMSSIQNSLGEAKRRLALAEREGIKAVPYELRESRADKSLQGLKLRLENTLNRYTENHPDVIALKKKIANVENLIKNSRQKNFGADDSYPYDALTKKFKRETLAEIEAGENEIVNIRKQMALYKKRVEDTPLLEQELLSLKRDYDNVSRIYNSLLERQLEAQIAVNMEKKQKGEQFRILDPARLPEKPVAPDIKKMFILFVGAGFAVGFCLIFLAEYFDSSFRDPKDMESFLGVSVFASIPTIIHASDIRKRRIRTTASAFGVIMSTALFAGFTLITFIKG